MGGLLVALFGSPGAGKSTVMRAFTAGRTKYQWYKPLAHMAFEQEVADGLPPVYVELGRERGDFSGTDALAMNVLPTALAFLEDCVYSLVIAEGDRLSNTPFFEGAAQRGWTVRRVWLDTPESLAGVRRALRGSRQHPSWIAGRVTKARKLGMNADLVLHGAIPARENAAYLKTKIQGWLTQLYPNG